MEGVTTHLQPTARQRQMTGHLMENSTGASPTVPSTKKSRRTGRNGKWFSRVRVSENLLEQLRLECADGVGEGDHQLRPHERLCDSLTPLAKVHCLGRPARGAGNIAATPINKVTPHACDTLEVSRCDSMNCKSPEAFVHARSPSEDEGISEVASLPSLDTGSESSGSGGHTSDHHHHHHQSCGTCFQCDFDKYSDVAPSVDNHTATLGTVELLLPSNLSGDVTLDLPSGGEEEDDENDTSSSSSVTSSDSGAGVSPDFMSQEGAVWAVTNCFSWLDDETFALELQDATSADEELKEEDEDEEEENFTRTNSPSVITLTKNYMDENTYIPCSSVWPVSEPEWGEYNKQMPNDWALQESSERLLRDVEKVSENINAEKRGENAKETPSGNRRGTCMTHGLKKIEKEKGGEGKEPSENEHTAENDLGKRAPPTPKICDVAWNREKEGEEDDNSTRHVTRNVELNGIKEETCGDGGGVFWESDDVNSRGSWSESDWSETDTCILRQPFVRDSDAASVDSIPSEDLVAGESTTSRINLSLQVTAADFNLPSPGITLSQQEGEPGTPHQHHHHHHHMSQSCLGCLVEGDKNKNKTGRGEKNKRREREEGSFRNLRHTQSWLDGDRWPDGDNRRWYRLDEEQSLGTLERESGRRISRDDACTHETRPGDHDRNIPTSGGDDQEMKEEEEEKEEEREEEFSKWRDLCRRLEDLSRDHSSYLKCHDHTSTTTVPRQPDYPPSPPPRRRRRCRRQSWATVGESCQFLPYGSAPCDPWLTFNDSTKQPQPTSTALRDITGAEQDGRRSEPWRECLYSKEEPLQDQRVSTSSDGSETECAGDFSDEDDDGDDQMWHSNDSLDCYSLGYDEWHSRQNHHCNKVCWGVTGRDVTKDDDASHVTRDARFSKNSGRRWKRRGKKWIVKKGRFSSHNLDPIGTAEYTWLPSLPPLIMPENSEDRDDYQAPWALIPPLHTPLSLPPHCICHHAPPPSQPYSPASCIYSPLDTPTFCRPPCLSCTHEQPRKSHHNVMFAAAKVKNAYTRRNCCDCGVVEGEEGGESEDRWPESTVWRQLRRGAAYGHHNVCKKNNAHNEGEGTSPREAGSIRAPVADAEEHGEFSTLRDSSWSRGNLHFQDGMSVATMGNVLLPSGAYHSAAARALNSQGECDHHHSIHSSDDGPTGFSQYYSKFHPQLEGEAARTAVSHGGRRMFQAQSCAIIKGWPGRGVPLGKRCNIIGPASFTELCIDGAHERHATNLSLENKQDSGTAASSLASLQRHMPVPASCFTHALCSRVPLYKRIQDALCSGAGALTSDASSGQQSAEPVITQPRSVLKDSFSGSGVLQGCEKGYSPTNFSFPEELDVGRVECDKLPEGHGNFSFDRGDDEGPEINTLKLATREPPDGTATPPAPVGSFLHRFSPLLPLNTRTHQQQYSVAEPHKEFLASEECYHHHYLWDAPNVEQRSDGYDLQDAIPAGLPPCPATIPTQLPVSPHSGKECSSLFLPPSPPPSPPQPQHANPLHRQPLECAFSAAFPHPHPTTRDGPQQLPAAAGRSSPCISRGSLELGCDDDSEFESVSLPSTPEASLTSHHHLDGAELQKAATYDANEKLVARVFEKDGVKLCSLSNPDCCHEECSILSPPPTSPHSSHLSQSLASSHHHSPSLETPSLGQINEPFSSHKSIISESPSQQSSILLAVDPPIPHAPDTFSLVDLMKLGSYDGYVTLPVTLKSAQIGEGEASVDSNTAQGCEESDAKRCAARVGEVGTEGDVIISTKVRVSLRKFCRRRRNGSKKLIIKFTLCLGKWLEQII